MAAVSSGISGPSSNKFSLFSAGLHGKILSDPEGPSSPKIHSARSKQSTASKTKPKRPSSANPRIRSSHHHREQPGRSNPFTQPPAQPNVKRASDPPVADYDGRNLSVLAREELIHSLTEVKKQNRANENVIAQLKADNQRMENEITKQQHRIDKILSPQFAKNTHLVLEIKKEIEKSVLVRQLKAQMLNLRATIAERDATIEAMQKKVGSSNLIELTAEKEEYFTEIKRLRRVIAEKDKEIQKEKESRAWEQNGAHSVEGDLREEIHRLSQGYQQVLERLEDTLGSRVGSPRTGTGTPNLTPRDGTGRLRGPSRPMPGGRNKSRPKSATSTGTAKVAAMAPDVPASDSSLPRHDPTSLDYIDPVLTTFDNAQKDTPVTDLKEYISRPTKSAESESPFPHLASQKDEKPSSLLEFSEDDAAVRNGPTRIVADVGRGNSNDVLPLGCLVEVRFGKGGTFYPGRICGNTGGSNGTYDIDYDNGNHESGVTRDMIRVVGGVLDSATKFKPGERVEAMFTGDGSNNWYKGVVSAVNDNGTYRIDYDDGDRETAVLEENIKSLETDQGRFKVGDRVQGLFDDSNWYPATVATVTGNKYKLDYDDGDVQEDVTEDRMKPMAAPDLKEPQMESKYRVGDRILAKYGGKTKYYPGVISQVRADGTYDIRYDDGESEKNVPDHLIKPKSSQSATGLKFATGDYVMVRYRGGKKQYPGTVRKVWSNGTYDIDYDDGEEERLVPENMVEHVGGHIQAPSPGPSTYSIGARVQVQYRGKGKFFPAVILRRCDGQDEQYDIGFDDGTKEERVGIAHIRPQGEDKQPSKAANSPHKRDEFKHGDMVEAKFGDENKFYRGVISGVNDDGTYVVEYEDGDRESKVLPTNMRKVDSNSVKKDAIENSVESAVPKPVVSSQGEEYNTTQETTGTAGEAPAPDKVVDADLNDYFAWLCDEDDNDDEEIGANLDAGESGQIPPYDLDADANDDYGEDFED
mmetsp:Transcript_15990/g.24106  ORF Transcript_15990/g.24106 Transcript_15990/m.24106 type:complete len:980 (+) Transcript_15990:164-3103(+)